MMFRGLLFGILVAYLVLLAMMASRYLTRRRPTQQPQPSGPRRRDLQSNGRPLIEVINVHKSFDQPVLQGLSLRMGRGETIGVLGQSGTGKSVLLKLMAGFLRPDSGMILYKGKEINTLDERDLLEFRKEVSYVFQAGAFFDFLNVQENIAYPLREQGITDEELIDSRVRYLLEAVELEGMGLLRYDELSTGAKKQVAIARAIANNPEVILYDEPTTGVDPVIGKALSRLIKKLDLQENLTSIVVTHDLRCLEIVSDRLILIKDGRIRFQGTHEAFQTSSDPFVQAFRTGKRYEGPRVDEGKQ